jgi:hypothetical protein
VSSRSMATDGCIRVHTLSFAGIRFPEQAMGWLPLKWIGSTCRRWIY